MIIMAILFFLAGCCKGIMDTLQFHYSESIFNNKYRYNQRFWNPFLSWSNKYRSQTRLTPKFPGSTTIFVFVTDAWHLFQFFMLTLIFTGVGVSIYIDMTPSWYVGLLSVLLLRLMFGLGFKLMYNKILIK